MGQQYLKLFETEVDELIEAKSLDKVHRILTKVLTRELDEMEFKSKATSRCRQLQDSQLLAAESFSTSKKTKPTIH